MIIGYCILIHPGICILWCRTMMRPARVVSYSVLYTTLSLIRSLGKKPKVWLSWMLFVCRFGLS